MKNVHFNYIDFLVLVLLIIGVSRGRKRGMSEELLTFFQWIFIVAGGASIYQPMGKLLSEHVPFSLLSCNVAVYISFALIVKIIFSQIQRVAGEKLVGSNFFGGSEYYLGMFAGMTRFACIILMLLALLNARLITDRERTETARKQSKNFEGVSFPTFGSIQHAVLSESFTGQQVKQHLGFALINSTKADKVVLRRGEGRAFNEVIDTAKK